VFACRVEVVRVTVLAAIGVLCACSAYDPTLARPRGLEADGGGSDSPDAGGDSLDATADAGDGGVDAGGDAGSDGSVHHQDCRPNLDPDPDVVAACPEICTEACNGLDDDCDGKADESEDVDVSCTAAHSVSVCQSAQCFVTQCLAGYRDCDQLASNGCEVASDDVNHCGSCGRACKIADAEAACVQGQCVVGKCARGYADCDMDGLTCEMRTNTLTNCAGCGVACIEVPNAVPSCATGVCGVATCKAGYGDCDGKPDNGCEQTLDTLSHCAACNTACTKASCGGGVCTAADCTSMPGHADCDRDEASCEIDLRSNVNNCGACGYQCKFADGVTPHAALGCGTSGCVANCDAGYGDCDGNYANGCEQPLNTLTNCGMCRAACTIAHATATCSTGSCEVQTCASDWADCDSDKQSCETQLNAPNHCGSCTAVCNYPNAVEGCGGTAGSRVCTVAGCDANYADCDTAAANGCERDTRTPGTGGLGPCLPDTACVKSTSGTHEYYVCPTARQWSDARSRCQLQARGDLVQLTDAAEDTFVKGKIGTTVWVGHNDSAHEGTWVWSRSNVPFWKSGTGAIASRYGNWSPGEPNNSGNCGALYPSGLFDDAACTNPMPFVCEVMPDECPSDAAKTDPGQCGCNVVDTDTDGDGVANCNDACANDPGKIAPGICMCGVADTNSDGDSALDCDDGCPNDPGKIAPGICMCGVADTDSDGDSALDCQENCDNDPAKLDPGICGCGKPETDTGDSDGDGTANCNDLCPLDNSTTGACFPTPQSNFTTANLNFTAAPTTTLNCGTTTINSANASPFSNWCGTAPSFVIQAQSGGPNIMVIALKGLTVSSGATLRLIGDKPVVFAVRGNVTVAGTIDANASGNTPGAGGNVSCGSSAGGNGTGDDGLGDGGGGGGGGALGTAGGRGGQGDEEGNNGNNYGLGGTARGSVNVTPLYGGCGGGSGGGCSSVPGAGGGAVQITASGTMNITGTIRAIGGNGATGCGTEGGGAGGGSGGAILLEAPTRNTSSATISASGGDGGDGKGISNGNGGSGSTSSSSGVAGGSVNGAGGGGGGGFGRIKK
jgi:hypothetical protein